MPSPTQLEAQRQIAVQIAAGCLFGSTELQWRSTLDRTVDVVAEHDMGFDAFGRRYPFTRLTSKRLLNDGGNFLRNIDGWLDDGALVAADNGRTYRLNVQNACADQYAALTGGAG